MIEQASSSVGLAAYQDLLDQADLLLVVYPAAKIVLLADRGFADTKLSPLFDRDFCQASSVGGDISIIPSLSILPYHKSNCG